MNPLYPLFINGEFREAKSRQAIVNPASGEGIAEVALASMKDIEAAIASAREAFDGGPWPRFSLSERKEFLLKISQGFWIRRRS